MNINFNTGDENLRIDETFIPGSTNAVESREIQRRFGQVEAGITALLTRTGFVVLNSESQLPLEPTESQRTAGFIIGQDMYVYVGSGGDAREGKYKNVGKFKPADGVSVVSLSQTSESAEDGGTNVLTMTLSDGTVRDFKVRNGRKGQATMMRVFNNHLQASFDDGATWKDVSDDIAAWFRVSTDGDNVTLQMSRDQVNYQDVCTFVNELRIRGQYATTGDVPSPKSGQLFLIGSAAPYELHLYDGSRWIPMGQFSATVASTQTTGQSTTLVMSQKAVTDKLSELDQNLEKLLYGGLSHPLRQGTFTNPSNATALTMTNIIPFTSRLYVSTDKPIASGYEYRFGVATYTTSSGLSLNGTIVRRQNVISGNSYTPNAGENGIAFGILRYNLSTETYDNLSLSEFVGYHLFVSQDDGDVRTSIDIVKEMSQSGVAMSALNQLRGGIFSLIGDSITTFVGNDLGNSYYPTTYTPADVNNIIDTWWMKVIKANDAKIDINASFGGARVTNTRPSGTIRDSLYDSTLRLGQNLTPDVIIVARGTNDSYGSVTLGDYDYSSPLSSYDESKFIPAYIKGIRQLIASFPNATIICLGLSMGNAYLEAIKNIAEHYSLQFIDVHNYSVCSDGTNVHPDNMGMNTIANAIMRYKDYEKINEIDDKLNQIDDKLNQIPYVDSFLDNFDALASKIIKGDLPLFSPVNGFLKDPSIWIHNGKWYMYCTTSIEGTTNFDTDWYSSTDGRNWKYERKVFTHTGSGYGAYCLAATSKAILVEGIWHIWVTCWGNRGWCIAHFTCSDIDNPTWEADSNNPIITNETRHILDPFIVFENNTYYMFATHDTTEQVCYATSSDCYTWSEMTDIPNVYGEGPMVIHAPNNKWVIMTARAGGNSLRNEDLDVFESSSLTSGYSYIGKPIMQLPSWANVCYGHGDLIKIPAGYFGFAKDKYILYYQATWDYGQHMVIGTAMSDDCYHWYPYNFGEYGWGDFFQIDNAGYLIIRKQNTLPNWKPFVRTYDYWRDFEISVRVTQLPSPTSKVAGLVFFGENAQYLNCLVVEYDIDNQLLVAKLLPKNNVGDAITYLSLPDPFIGAGSHLLLKVERKGTTIGVTAFKADDEQAGSTHYFDFDMPGFERMAFGLISENSEAYFSNVALYGNH